MRLVFFAMLRLLVTAAVLLTVLAVVIGRSQRVPAGPRGPAAAPRVGTGHQAVHDGHDSGSVSVLDVETGAVARVGVPPPDVLRFAACSPWRDGAGRTQVAAQWRGLGAEGWGMGLARLGIPGGTALDRVAMDVMPMGAPCWFPDGSARVLFGGGDGRLYRVGFDDRDRAFPSPMAWRPTPAAGELHVADPTWPAHSRFADVVLATVADLRPGEPPPARRPSRLWWLRLDPAHAEVVDAGALIEPDPVGHAEGVAGEYLGTVSAAPDGGGAVLAYLVRRPTSLEVRLRLAPLAFDPATGTPRAREADAVEPAGARAFSPPAFSGDGRWVYSFPAGPAALDRADRASVADALARPRPAHTAVAWNRPRRGLTATPGS